MTEILAAILDKFNASASLTSTILGGLFFSAVPPVGVDIPRPFCFYHTTSGDKTVWSFGASGGIPSGIEPNAFQFNIEADGGTAAVALAEAFDLVFNDQPLTLTSPAKLMMFKRRWPIKLFPTDVKARNESAEYVYRSILTYDVFVQTT